MFALLILAAAPPDAFAQYREATRAEVPCHRPATPDEVTVCGLRDADRRYRVPLVGIAPRDDVPRERTALLTDPIDHCGRRWNLTDCGFAGVTVTTGGAGSKLTTRKVKE